MEKTVSSQIKVVHISWADFGGAGMAAIRLHKALLEIGVNSWFLCLHKNTTEKNVVKIEKPLWVKLAEKSKLPFGINKHRKFAVENFDSYECISFPDSIFDISNHPIIQDADIINLHWIGQLFNYKKFFIKNKKSIVWTIHDMNSFLGYSHYYGDTLKNSININYEKQIQEEKRKIYKKAHDLTIVSLCHWMDNYLSKLSIFKGSRNVIIPNSLNTEVFKCYDSNKLKEIFNIPKDKTVFLFVSQNLNNFRKGGDLLNEAIDKTSNDFFYITVGNGKISTHNKNIINFGSIHDELLMALIYSVADAFILPSREDNLPNTMLESLSCGTPVLAFSNGGMSDIIQEGFNGYLANQINSESLKYLMLRFIKNKDCFNRNEISKKAHNLFAPLRQANEYLDLYNNILSKKKY